MLVTCKKWHVAKRLVDRVRDVTGIPAVHYLFNEAATDLPDLGGIQTTLEKRYGAGQLEIRRTEMVGPQVGKDLRSKGVQAIIFSIIGMLIYVTFRFEFRFGVGAVIPGFAEALQLMPAGSHYRIWIPSDLAYGPQGSGPVIGPNAVLVFEIELLEVLD